MSAKVTRRGDPRDLTWALYSYPDAVHAIPGKYTDGVYPSFPRYHIAAPDCPCGPTVTWDSEAAPLPLYEHR